MTTLESFFIGVRSKDRFCVNRALINFLILKQVQSGADSEKVSSVGRSRGKRGFGQFGAVSQISAALSDK